MSPVFLKASDVRLLKNLEEENSRFKRIFAELSINDSIFKDVISKKAGAQQVTGTEGVHCK